VYLCIIFTNSRPTLSNSQVTNSTEKKKINKLNKLMSPLETLNIIALFFNIIIPVRSNICPICQQIFECPMQRTMLAAVPPTNERLIAPLHFIQISVHHFLTSSACCSHCKTLVAIYWMHFRLNLICIKSVLPTKQTK